MAIEKLERVMERIRVRNKGESLITYNELRRAIMLEIGTDDRTYYQNKKALVKLQWIKKYSSSRCELTDKDLTGDF